MTSKPVIFLAFANDKEVYALSKRLNLADEQNEISKVLQEKAIEKELLMPFNKADFLRIFAEKGKDFQVFHYGGHGGKDTLFFENFEDNQAVRAEYLINYLASFELKLIFLNACDTYEIGVSCVQTRTTAGEEHETSDASVRLDSKSDRLRSDATHAPLSVSAQTTQPCVICAKGKIDDHTAIEFSRTFYLHLANRYSIRESFEKARNANEMTENRSKSPNDWHLLGTDEGKNWKLEKPQENYTFNTYLIKNLLPALQAYSQNATNLMCKVQTMPNWERNEKVVAVASEILSLFVGMIGVQINKLILIGQQNMAKEYLNQCFLIAKITLDLLSFVLLSKLWDLVGEQKLALNHTQKLQIFFENSFDFSLKSKLDLIRQIEEIYAQNQLAFPFEELNILHECLQESHVFCQNFQILATLEQGFDKNRSEVPLEQVAKAEKHLTHFLENFAFLVRFKMSSFKQIGYKLTRNSPAFFIHHYSPIDHKKTDNPENILLNEFSMPSHTVLFHKGTDYQNHVNLFPFVIDYNALTFEQLSKIYFFNALGLDNSLEYVCLDDNSEIQISLTDTSDEKELSKIIGNTEKHKKFNLEQVFLKFQEAKNALLQMPEKASGEDFSFEMVNE